MRKTPKAVGDSTSLVMLRARITPDEYRAFKVAALEANQSSADWNAAALRSYLAKGKR